MDSMTIDITIFADIFAIVSDVRCGCSFSYLD